MVNKTLESCWDPFYDANSNLPEDSEFVVDPLRRERFPNGIFYGGIGLDFRKYKLIAYPGPKVVSQGRVEHIPLHVHVCSPDGELRINVESMKELDDMKIPKDLRKYLGKNKSEIAERVSKMFNTGKLN